MLVLDYNLRNLDGGGELSGLLGIEGGGWLDGSSYRATGGGNNVIRGSSGGVINGGYSGDNDMISNDDFGGGKDDGWGRPRGVTIVGKAIVEEGGWLDGVKAMEGDKGGVGQHFCGGV
nr:hypothetical protein Iba_chr12aCG12150 [Ipomoea batatas]